MGPLIGDVLTGLKVVDARERGKGVAWRTHIVDNMVGEKSLKLILGGLNSPITI